jgi:hypothetical protein
MEDTLSFEDMATECKPFEPTYTEEFRQYMQESVNASRKAHAEAVQSISNIFMIEGNAISITNKEMEDYWERRYQELMSLPKEELVKMIIGSKDNIGILLG